MVLQDFPTKLRELRKLAKQRRNAYRRSRILLAAQLHVGAASRHEENGKRDAEREVKRAVESGKVKPASAKHLALFQQYVPELHDSSGSLSPKRRSRSSSSSVSKPAV